MIGRWMGAVLFIDERGNHQNVTRTSSIITKNIVKVLSSAQKCAR